MSWSAFEELKSFASSIYGSKKKRKQDWNVPTTKRPKTSGQLSNMEEGSIGGFSSEEESDETCRPLLTKDSDKNGHRHPAAKKKRIVTDSSDGATRLENLIEDSEDTPQDGDGNSLCKSEQTQHEQLEEILDAMIKDFNSSDEEEKVENPESLDIETPTPSLTPTHQVIPGRTPKTGSEWLKQVQQHSSSASQNAPFSPDLKVDSAKKKHKLKRSGLAEQLQRIINREKSEKSFWAHKQTSKNEKNGSQDSSSSLDVQILSLQSQYSLHITRCCLLTNPPNVLDIVFDTQTMKQLMLRVGSAVRIHPPWQKLHVPSSPFPVLLGTYYCEVLPTPSGPPPVDVDSIPVITSPSSKVVQGATSLVSSPRKSFQPTRLLFEEAHSTKDDEPNTTETISTNDQSQNKKTKKHPSIAKAIEAQGGCSGGSISFEALVQRVYRRRVKVARDKAFDSPGDIFLSKTLVTRARSAEDKEEARWVILVQDSSKNVCEIQIPEEYANTEHWVSCIREGVVKACLFADLRISKRTTRTRSPGLFNVVDSLWKSEDRKTQEDKSSQILNSDESISQRSSPPNYCYVLTVQHVSRVTALSDDGYHDLCLLYTPSLQSTIREMFLHNEDTPKRSSVWCRVICSRPSLKISTRLNINHPSWTGKVLVTDVSLHRPPQESHDKDSAECLSRYVSLEVRPSHVLTESVIKTLSEAGNVLYMEDVACTGKDAQGIYADSYTTIRRGMTDPCQAEMVKGDVKVMPLSICTELMALRTREFISPLSSTTTQGSLCKIQGAVSGVDEESACCWLECSTCGSQDLMERNGLPYYCPLCKTDVPEPQTRTNLDVMIKCDSWNEGQVVIKLLQGTIEQVLPVSYQNSDQGYDIDCVLGKRLGPLYCYVDELNGATAKLDEIAVTL